MTLKEIEMSFNAEYNADIAVTTEEVVRAVQKLENHLAWMVYLPNTYYIVVYGY